MREDELRSILLVKAIEETDGAGTLLPPADRVAAARDARRAAREAAGSEVMEQGALSEAAQRMGAAILRYLAVAHYGRGRGDWVESEYPGHWRPLVAEVAARCRGELEPIWNAEGGTSADEVAQLLRPLLSRATREVLERLYPEASELFAEAIPNLGSGS